MKPLAFIVLSAAILFAQRTVNENMVRQRGQTPVQDNRESMSYGRIGTQQMMPKGQVAVTGILIDASCDDRTSLNMRSQPLPLPPVQSQSQNSGAVSASGINVSPQTTQNERADVLPHLVPDILTRQEDPTCAVTAATRGYSVLTDNGRLLDLDEGGNTLANVAISGNPAGRAMLNGKAPGLKPRVVLKGWVFDDKVIVDSIQQLTAR